MRLALGGDFRIWDIEADIPNRDRKCSVPALGQGKVEELWGRKSLRCTRELDFQLFPLMKCQLVRAESPIRKKNGSVG